MSDTKNTANLKADGKRFNGIELTPVESLLFFNIVRFNKDPTAVDWDQVALHSNLKNAGSAKVRHHPAFWLLPPYGHTRLTSCHQSCRFASVRSRRSTT